MYRMMPFRRYGRRDSFMPQAFHDFFSWPDVSWQSFNVDVKETPEGYAIQADLPGVNKSNIKLSVDNGYLNIAVRQEELKSENNENYICRERRQMSSQRSFYVGNVNPEDVQAKYENGVLEIKVPKGAAGPNHREIPIQ
ncbi:MAG: Hsp20/alpha crystallin family protein [Firmicutes bacterium]|nr:Hsp20/alpha crystallin family protein [Bacillota bacterium]